MASDSLPLEPLLDVRDLRVAFRGSDAPLQAIDGLSFTLHPGEILGLVGESGSGKTVASLALMGLLAPSESQLSFTHLRVLGHEVGSDVDASMQGLRGREIAMIFQDPMSSLSPYQRIRDQMDEVLREHGSLRSGERHARCVEGLLEVGISDPEEILERYAHQLSGGQCQRISIAMALLCDPHVLIADEPTTALDVTVQAVILKRLGELARERNMGVVFITHDLGVVAGLVDRVMVLYAGKSVEHAPVRRLFEMPSHPYTQALMDCLPRMDGPIPIALSPLPGRPPSLDMIPSGCAFHPRCERAEARCALESPRERVLEKDHASWCHFADEFGAVKRGAHE
jgi:oligopeptide/dipeptide ABC transporter ATP-binding protein